MANQQKIAQTDNAMYNNIKWRQETTQTNKLTKMAKHLLQTNIKGATKWFDHTTVADRLTYWTVRWNDNSHVHSTDVDYPV